MIRESPHYRREAFVNGLTRAGYTVNLNPPAGAPAPDDVLVIWNRYSYTDQSAKLFEQHGAMVIVAENGYVGMDADRIQYYALAIGGHNGSGRWWHGDASRWNALNIELKPWQSNDAGHIFIRGQRGIGTAQMASPPLWHNNAAKKLQALTKRRVEVRDHPGKPANHPGIAAQIVEELRGAYAACIWSSGIGVRALVEGIPVFFDAPNWICESAGVKGIENIANRKMDDAARLASMHRLAYAQWSVAELNTGEPFVLLRDFAQGRAKVAA